MGSTLDIGVNQSALLCAGVVLWILASAFVGWRTPLRTWLRGVDAVTLPPLVAAAIFCGVWLADLVLPHARQLWAAQELGVAASLGTVGHETLTIVTTILIAALAPGMILWAWRRYLFSREDNIHNRRAERASMALERRRPA